MILTYPHYLDQTQIIGLDTIMEYHGISQGTPYPLYIAISHPHEYSISISHLLEYGIALSHSLEYGVTLSHSGGGS